MNFKLSPVLIALAAFFLGVGLLAGWALWHQKARQIPKDATVRMRAPLLPLPPLDSGPQSPARASPEGKPDTLAERLQFEQNKVLALQRLSSWYRDSIGGLLEKLKLPYRFTAVKDTNLPHTKDSVVIDLMTGKADFFQSGLSEPVGGAKTGRISLFPARQSIFDFDLQIYTKGPTSASLSIWNPFRPAWWIPGEIGVAARVDGAKGINLGWPIP